MSAPYLTADATAPARRAAVITPSDTETFGEPTRFIHVGAAGAVKVDMVGGGTVTFSGLAAGSRLDVQATRVYATGTTATSLVALY